MSECKTCGGKGAYVARVDVTGFEEFKPCPTCRRIVSVSDAEVAAAVREIEAEGLTAVLTVHDRDGFPNLWEVGQWTMRCEGELRGEGPTLPEALKAYRRAREGR